MTANEQKIQTNLINMSEVCHKFIVTFLKSILGIFTNQHCDNIILRCL